MPEPDEQELGPQLADAFQSKAYTVQGLRSTGYAREARRRVHKRRQRLTMAAAAVVVVVAIGGVWGIIGGPSPVTTSADSNSAGSAADNGSKAAPQGAPEAVACPEQHAILTAGREVAIPPGTGLDLDNTPVFGLEACRYRLTAGAQMLLGSASFNATTAQQVVDAIKVLPERNPALPVFACPSAAADPSEAIVLRFDTATGLKEVWVEYGGCATVGLFSGTRTYGLFAAPLKLFMTGTVRPSGSIFLDHLKGW